MTTFRLRGASQGLRRVARGFWRHGSALDDEQRRSLCPRCVGGVQGKACCLVVGHGVRTIHYVCTVCFDQWQYAVLIPASQSIFPMATEE